MTDKRKVWEKPWGFAEGFIFVLGIAFIGLALQISLGSINASDFHYPVNLLIGLIFCLCISVFYFFKKKNRIITWFASVKATVPALIVLLTIIVVMGFTPQFTTNSGLPTNVFRVWGWYQMTCSWTFVLLCFYLLFILGLTTLKRTKYEYTHRDIGFYLIHLGLFIALLSAILGSAELQRLKMTVKEGTVEWRATDENGKIYELPVAIQLDTFKIEEYPPKLLIINNTTGKILPEKHPDSYMFERVGKSISIAGKHIEIKDYLPHAGLVQDSVNVTFAPFHGKGAARAIKVKLQNPSIEGWVSSGSYMFPYQALNIDNNTSLVMAMPEVKKYTSTVTVYTQKGHTKKADIEVNKPLKIEKWMIYQLSYDETKGKYSDTSVFELVSDPYLTLVYVGILMLMAGSVYLFMAGAKKHGV